MASINTLLHAADSIRFKDGESHLLEKCRLLDQALDLCAASQDTTGEAFVEVLKRINHLAMDLSFWKGTEAVAPDYYVPLSIKAAKIVVAANIIWPEAKQILEVGVSHSRDEDSKRQFSDQLARLARTDGHAG